MSFKTKLSFEQRIAEYNKMSSKYPDKIPVILEYAENGVVVSTTRKLMAHPDLTVADLIKIAKQKTNSSDAVFIMVNNKIMPSTTPISLMYVENKDVDGFLYVIHIKENCFG